MGIMQNKVTRRVALGSLVVGLGSAPLVLHNLRGRYETNIPSVSHPIVPSHVKGTGTIRFDDGYTLKVPAIEMDTTKPGDWEEYQSLAKEAARKALDNDPGYKAHLERQKAVLIEKMDKELKERTTVRAKTPQEQMKADIQQFNKKIDNDDTIDAANKELIKKGFRESMEKSYQTIAANLK